MAQAPARRPAPRKPPPPTKAAPQEVYDDDGTTDQCPEPFGFFADAEQCDKYYECKWVFLLLFPSNGNNKFINEWFCDSDGVITEKLCPDGMVFNDFSPDQEKCDLPFNIDCSQRSKLRK